MSFKCFMLSCVVIKYCYGVFLGDWDDDGAPCSSGDFLITWVTMGASWPFRHEGENHQVLELSCTSGTKKVFLTFSKVRFSKGRGQRGGGGRVEGSPFVRG